MVVIFIVSITALVVGSIALNNDDRDQTIRYHDIGNINSSSNGMLSITPSKSIPVKIRGNIGYVTFHNTKSRITIDQVLGFETGREITKWYFSTLYPGQTLTIKIDEPVYVKDFLPNGNTSGFSHYILPYSTNINNPFQNYSYGVLNIVNNSSNNVKLELYWLSLDEQDALSIQDPNYPKIVTNLISTLKTTYISFSNIDYANVKAQKPRGVFMLNNKGYKISFTKEFSFIYGGPNINPQHRLPFTFLYNEGTVTF